MASDDRFDRRRREILTVHAKPVRVPAGEVDPAVIVYVTKVPAPVPPLAGRLAHGLLVLVIALERPHAERVDHLPDAAIRIDETAVVVELGARHLDPILVHDQDPLPKTSN